MVTTDDITRWIDEDRFDILSCLTWYTVFNPSYHFLVFPMKGKLLTHNYLRDFYKEVHAGSKECIFLDYTKEGNSFCRIHKTKPYDCLDFPDRYLKFICPGLKGELTQADKDKEKELKKKRKTQNKLIMQSREMLSTVIRRAKEQTTKLQLSKLLIGGEK